MSGAAPGSEGRGNRLWGAGAVLILLGLVAGVASVSFRRASLQAGWPDEWIYLTLARNIGEKGTLNTNFYIASSLETLGYPHRDVHLPGYALALAASSGWRGYSFETAIALNVVSFAISVLSAFFLARAFFSIPRSLAAAALVAVLPPFPGYLAVAYPEHVTAAALLALVAAAAWIEGRVATFFFGFAVGGSLLFRETSLFALPVFGYLLGERRFFRLFLPGLLLFIATLLPPLAAKRAIHPNALYPSAVTEALRSEEPVTRLAATIARNARINLDLLAASNPKGSAEDAALFFLIGLSLLGLAASFSVGGRERGFLRATFVSAGLLFAAMVAIYVVRERGGVWGGVRALMPMAPLLVVGLCGLRMSRTVSALLGAGVISLSLFLDSWQIAFFNRYKGSNLEDQSRAAAFIKARTDRFGPRRVVGGRYFQYGFLNYPVEVVWNGPDEWKGLDRLYARAPFDFVVIHRSSPMRFDLRKDDRYEWINASEGQAAEYQIYRRVAP